MSNKRLRGIGWKELIKSPEYYAQQTKENLSPIISKLAAVANKRLKRMEQLGISYSTYQGPDKISGVKKFGAKNKTLGQLRSEYKRLQGFLESPLSSLTGRKETYYQAKKRMWEKATPEEREKIGEKPTRGKTYKEYLSSKRTPNGTELDETEIFDRVGALFQTARENGWLSKSETLYQMRGSDQIRDYYEEQVIKANLLGVDVVELVKEDLGIDTDEEEKEDIDFSTSNLF